LVKSTMPVAFPEDTNNIAGVGQVSRYITGLVERGHIAEALAALIDAALLVAGGPYAPKQQTNASNRWKRAIDGVVAAASDRQVRELLEHLPQFPDVAAQLVITAIIRTAFEQFRPDLNKLLTQPLPSKAAAHLRRHLRDKAREFGSRAWPEIASPPT